MNNSNTQQKPAQPVTVGFGRGGPGGGGAMMSGAAKPKNFSSSLKKLAAYMKPYWVSIVVVFIFAIASTVFTIVSPKILGNVTNQIVNDYIDQTVYDQIIQKLPPGATIPAGTTGSDIISKIPPSQLSQIPSDQLERIKVLDLSSRPTFHFDDVEKIVLFLIALYILSALFNYAQGYIMAGVSQKITFKLRADISEKINRLPLKYFDTNTHGDILSRITNDVDTVNQSLNQSLTQIVTSVTTIIGIALFMLSISWELTLVAILVLPLSFGFIAFIVKQSQALFKQQQVSLGEMNGHIEEMYAGHSIVKAYNGEKESIKKFTSVNKDLYDSGWKSQFFSGLLFPIINFVGNLGYVAVAVLGGYLAIQGKLQIGDIQAFIQYLQQFNQPVIQAANITTVLQSTVASAERVFEFLEEKDEIRESESPVKIDKVKGNVEFDNVIFGYNPDKTIIKGFTANAKSGQRIAIVGPTGAGKTTMVNLLMRFYDVNSGSIKVDGVDTRDMKRSDVRKLFGMVLQDTWLFNGTIRDNIKYGKPDATEKELEDAAKAAHVDHFVHSLPNGYDMVLNEAIDNISQGEKQLLTIARAMLVNPPMLILDEATSSVDTRTEVLIQKAMENLMKDRTSFVIAHRLSTIKNADLILVMNKGNIVEQGTHNELIKQKGFYENLYNSQFAE